jgi:penicillin G amidase
VIKASLFLIAVLLIVGSGYAYWLCQQSMPIVDGVVSVPELDSQVKVRFDQSEVPYILAVTEKDLFASQGFVTASQRMFQMDMLRRAARGELSEVFGSTCLAHDKLARTLGFTRIAKIQQAALKPETKAKLKAYCDGVNAYISESEQRTPLEFMVLAYRPHQWQITDTLAILSFLQYNLDESWRLDDFRTRVLTKVGPKLASELFDQPLSDKTVSTSYALPDLQNKIGNLEIGNLKFSNLLVPPNPSWGSSAWTISATLSNSKGCLLACDRHGPFSFPDLWYSCSLEGPNIHVAGATIPGVPGILFGRNEKIAWAANSFKADCQDLFVEQFSDKFPSKYRVPFGWSTADELTEEIGQRFRENVIQKISVTRHGPVLSMNDNVGVALAWSGFQQKQSVFDTLWKINKAKDWGEFRDALKTYTGSPQTFLCADSKGNIGLQVAGTIPTRKSDKEKDGFRFSDGSTLLPGWLDQNLWGDPIVFDDLPSAFNSSDGFLVADDAKYSGMYLNSNKVIPRRISDVLAQYRRSNQHPDLPEMSSLQGDQQAYLEATITSELAKAAKRTESINIYEQKALSILQKSDNQLRGDNASASIYEVFINNLMRRILEPKLGAPMMQEYVQRWPRWTEFVEKVLREKPKDLLPPEGQAYDVFLLTTFVDTLKDLRLAFKTEEPSKWTWRSLHQINFRDILKGEITGPAYWALFPFAPSTVGVGGDQDSVFNCNYQIDKLPAHYNSDSGPLVRTVIDMADDDKFYQTLTLGQSGHLPSFHRTDQVRSWINCDPQAMAFSRTQLDRQLQHTLILTNRYQ